MRLFKAPDRTALKIDLKDVRLEPHDNACVFNRFACGKKPLDAFIRNKAAKSASRREHRVYVAMLAGSNNCIAYFALQIGSDAVPDTPREKASYLQSYTAFPAVHLSFLTVDAPYQRQGIGTYLLMDIFERVAAISEHVGFYALTLQSFDAESTAFYQSLGFAAYTDGPQPKMLYPLENVLATVKSAR